MINDEELGYEESHDNNWDIQLQNSMIQDWYLHNFIKKNTRCISRYPNAIILCRKDIFQKMMNLAAHLDAEAFSFSPPTFVFPREREKFIEYQEQHKDAIFIGKPADGAQGASIILFDDLNKVPLGMENMVT